MNTKIDKEKIMNDIAKTTYKYPNSISVDSEKLHKEEFMQRIKAMTPDELKMVVDYAPIELCMDRISKELESAKQLKESIIGLSNSCK